MLRVISVAVGLLSYTWLWAQAVALTNQVTKAILGFPVVVSGIHRMFEVLIAGVALGGLPLVGLIVMAAGAIQLLLLIFVKVVLILAGALVYATGGLMIGLAPLERGHAVARAWLSLAIALFALSVIWATVFAIAAVLINDATSAAAFLGGQSNLGHRRRRARDRARRDRGVLSEHQDHTRTRRHGRRAALRHARTGRQPQRSPSPPQPT